MEMTLCNAGYIGNCNGIYQHRLVMEEILGRTLSSSEIVHHRDGVRTNNEPDNLFLFESKSTHMKFHWYTWKNGYISEEEFIEKYN